MNSNFNINRINFKGIGFKGSENKPDEPTIDNNTKTVDASAQDAMGALGAAQVNIQKKTAQNKSQITSDNKNTENVKHYTKEEKTEKLKSFWPIKLSDEEFEDATNMDDVHFERMLKYLGNYSYKNNAYDIAKLNDEEYEKFGVFESVKYPRIKADEIIKYIKEKDDPDEFNSIKSVLDEYGDTLVFRSVDNILMYSSLEDNEKSRIEELTKEKKSYNESEIVFNIIKMEPNKYNKVLDLIKNDVSDHVAVQVVDFNPDQQEFFKGIIKTGVDDYHAKSMAENLKDKPDMANYILSVSEKLLKEKKLDTYHVSKMADFDSLEKCKQFVEMTDIISDRKTCYLEEFSNQEPEKYKKIKTLLKDHGIEPVYIHAMLNELSPERFEDLNNMLIKGLKQDEIWGYKDLDEAQAKKFKSICDAGLHVHVGNCVTRIGNDEELTRFNDFIGTSSMQSILKNDFGGMNDFETNNLLDKFINIIEDKEKCAQILNTLNDKNVTELVDENLFDRVFLGKLISCDKNKIEKFQKLCTYDNFKILIKKNKWNELDLSTILDVSDQELQNFENALSNEKFKTLIDKLEVPHDSTITMFLFDLNNEKIDKTYKILNNPSSQKYIDEGIIDFSTCCAILNKMPDSDIENMGGIIKDVDAQYSKILEHPELYVNGEFETREEALALVNDTYKFLKPALVLASCALDKEAINNLLRMRLDGASEYLSKLITQFKEEDIELLKEMASSCNIDGKPFMPTQKIELIDLISGYKNNNLDMSKMYEMIKQGRIDIAELNLDLFKGVLKNCGLSDEEISTIPNEKLMNWDIKYAHLLAKEINGDDDEDIEDEDDEKPENQAMADLMRVANLGNFEQYIQDETNIYGKTNAKTREIFKNCGLNYDAWLKPSPDNNVQFLAKDKNLEQLSQITEQLEEDIESLRKTPVKGFIDKQFKKYIKNDEFIVPTEFTKSKAKLDEFINNILKQLDPVFKRAEGNLNNPDKAQSAQNTLTIKDHLNQRLNDISKVSDSKSTKTLDLTIKMWDRNPQKDIFQGNYSTCCIGMGGGNGAAMPHYLLNTSYNMIELIDNISGKTIGNALCYFIKDNNNKPCLIIDNIEINNSNRPSNEVGIKLRNAITEYASKMLRDVTGSDDTKIYMSSQYNDVPCDDLKTRHRDIEFLGDTDCDEIYMDLYDGWVKKKDYSSKRNLLELK